MIEPTDFTQPTTDEPVIQIRGLRTEFNKKVIHNQLDLDIYRGEVIALIGGSGVGKSTLLREIILLEKPVEGTITVFNQDILHLNPLETLAFRRRCGVTFQHGALFSSLTLAENIAVPLREHTQLSPRLMAEIIAFKIALVGLPADAAAKYPDQLSGGMIKRAALARALALDPELLFLDEPTAGLDPISAGALDELVLQLRQLLGLTIVIVTHDLDTLWKVTDRIAVLAEQHVVAVASIRDLLQVDHPWIQTYFSGPRGRALLPYKRLPPSGESEAGENS